jgi:hypothetical protein
MKKVASGLASYARMKAVIGAIVSVVVVVVLIVIGRLLIRTKRSESTMMKVTSVGFIEEMTDTTPTVTTIPTVTTMPTVTTTPTVTATPTATTIPTMTPEVSGSCASIVNNGKVSYRCILSGTYTVKGKEYKATNLNFSGSSPITRSQSVKLFYDPKDPTDAVLAQVSSKTVGWILIGVAILILILSTLGTIFVFSSKGYATIEGGVGAASSLKNAIFRRRRK